MAFISKTNNQNFTLAQLDIIVPRKIECCWSLLNTTPVSGNNISIVLCSFYCPPQAKKEERDQLIDHIVLTWQDLKMKIPKAGIVAAGDANELEWDKIIQHDDSFFFVFFINLTNNLYIFIHP